MFKSELILRVCSVWLLGSGTWCNALDYHLGRPATPAQIAGWDIDVRPDGTGLPQGRGSVSDGSKVYDENCATCHGTFGDSNEYIALAGGVGSLGTIQPVRTVGSKLNHATTLFDYINRAMPFPHSKSLNPDQVYAVAAYILNLNEIVPASFVADRTTLPAVAMPNRNGFAPFPGLMSVQGKPDTHNTACMNACDTSVTVTGELPASFVQNMYGDLSNQFRGLFTMHPPPVEGETAGQSGANGADTGASAGAALLQKYGCSACHSVDKAVVGPALRSVAVRYKGDVGATTRLSAKIRSGGSGNWGQIPMPPQAAPSDADLFSLVQWILAGAPEK